MLVIERAFLVVEVILKIPPVPEDRVERRSMLASIGLREEK
jgi:hypothetical protein